MLAKFKNILLINGLLIIIAGCSTTQTPPIARYDADVNYQFPTISVYNNQLSKHLQQRCQTFIEESSLNHCQINSIETQLYLNEFSKSKLFEGTYLAKDEVEYSIAIATASLDTETVGDISQAALSGASLLLIPMTNEMTVETQVSVYWRNIKIKQYDYQFPHISSISLFSNAKDADNEFAQRVVSHVIKDLQTDQTLSTRFLTHALKVFTMTKSIFMCIQSEK